LQPTIYEIDKYKIKKNYKIEVVNTNKNSYENINKLNNNNFENEIHIWESILYNNLNTNIKNY
jgi:hypothetical protein